MWGVCFVRYKHLSHTSRSRMRSVLYNSCNYDYGCDISTVKKHLCLPAESVPLHDQLICIGYGYDDYTLMLSFFILITVIDFQMEPNYTHHHQKKKSCGDFIFGLFTLRLMQSLILSGWVYSLKDYLWLSLCRHGNGVVGPLSLTITFLEVFIKKENPPVLA